MTPHQTSRVDLHCHSTASERPKLGVQRSVGLPECATPPEDVLELALRRGMDFVTITDHDTIAGVEEIADDPRVFVSEELTTWFRGEPQAVHVLCYGITPDDHAWLQAHAADVEVCAAYLHEREIATALAHPFYAVEAPLTPRHRRRLAELFPVWETRNGARARELNAPAATYIETHGGTGIGGSDCHAGVDIGRTFTETPHSADPAEFLAHLRAGSAQARGDHGSAAKWAHAAMALATRALGHAAPGTRPDPRSVLAIAERLMREGDRRSGTATADLGPDDARALLAAWMDAVGVPAGEEAFLAYLQADLFSHADLFRRARRAHERELARAVDEVVAQVASPGRDLGRIAGGLFDACVAAIPYVPAAAFLGRETSKLVREDGSAAERLRVALVTDGVGSMHGVTHTLDEIRERGVPGFDVEVIGTDPNVDRRLSAVAEVDIPLYAGLKVGVPSLPALVETLAAGRYDVVHLTAPGPAGAAAAVIARLMGMPVLGSYHTEFAAYAALRSPDPMVELIARMATAAFYGACDHVLSPSPQSDEALRAMGLAPEKIGRWDRGVDLARFHPARRVDGGLGGGPERVNVLYAGRLTREKGVPLLAESFLRARELDPRLHLVLAGGGPEEGELRARLGEHVTLLGWQDGEDLARTYAGADVFLFPSRTDTFGQVVLEAQASGLPVVAVAEGGPCSLVEDGVTGLLRPADAAALATAVVEVAGSPLLREKLARAAQAAVRDRTWERALGRLAEGYQRTLGAAASAEHRRAA
jgi:glycosyltransferase involved in cell wall biosynthesis/predicted metal-dependent phosphoesterase TrpH